ncbi:TonB-dependent receptor [Chitinophaga sp. Cy-1792]|uniref:TonB-dependent receptor n=1 Tax=Chitinophaga sp. Cy-1792 TaxID=2608339 RepID=UPI0014236928
MKLVSLLMLTVSANHLYAQSYKGLHDKVSLQFEKSNAVEIVKSLQKQTPYTFVYDPEYLQHCTVGAVKFNAAPLTAVLEYLDYNAPIDIELTTSNTIALRKGRAEKPASRADGRVTGKVVDSKNDPIPGVTILVSNGAGTVTNVDGSFDLPLAPGSYTLTFSFISYDSRKITDVVVAPKGTTPLNVVLKNNGAKLKEVTVTGTYKRASVEGLYALQKNSAGITDGISAAQIGRTPDKNVGEVLKRVSGLSTMENKYVVVRGLSERYNLAVLNGQIMPSTELNRKNFNYDIIPANLIENVTVVKTLTPDRSAEFGGGLVEVNTIDIPTESFFNIAVGASYNDKTTGKQFLSLPLEGKEYSGQISDHRKWYGRTDWSSNKELADAAAAWPKDKSMFNNNWILTDLKAPVSPNFQISGGKVLNRHFGFVASLGYRNTFATQDVISGRDGFEPRPYTEEPDSTIFHGQRYGFTSNINGLWGVGYRNERNKISYNGLFLQVLDQQLTVGKGYHDASGPKSMQLQDITTQSKILQHQLKGEHLFGNKGIKLKWQANYMTMDKIRPDNHMLIAEYYPNKNADLNDISISNYFPNGRSGVLRWWSRAKEKNLSWDMALSAPFKLGPLANTAKIGYSGWNKDRYFFVANTSTAQQSYGVPQPLSKYFKDSGQVAQLDGDRDDFKANVSLNAVYAMLDNKWGKFRLVWGVRAENYNLNDVNAVLERAINPANNGNKKLDASEVLNREPGLRFFPSANLTYSLTPAMNLRLAYAESIIRPDLRELSYFREYDYELGGEYLALDPIRSTTIKHYDFRYEWYPSPGDIVSASVFMKKLEYPMEIYQQGSNRIFNLKNNKSADNYGLEVEVRKSFAFTNVPVLRNFTLYGNFTYLDAWVKPLSTTIIRDENDDTRLRVMEKVGAYEHRPQSGASNYMMNAGIYYDLPVFTASMNYNFVTNRVFRPVDTWQNSFIEQPLKSLDAQISGKLLRNRMEIKLSMANILNSYSVVYQNMFQGVIPKNPSKSEMEYQSSRDLINYRLAPGRTYSATLTYKF